MKEIKACLCQFICWIIRLLCVIVVLISCFVGLIGTFVKLIGEGLCTISDLIGTAGMEIDFAEFRIEDMFDEEKKEYKKFLDPVEE